MTHRFQRLRRIAMIRAVLFDFGGVLAEEGFQKGLRAIAERAGADPEVVIQAGERLVYETGYVVGKASEETFWKALRDETGIRLGDADMRETILSQFVLRPSVMEWVRRLRGSGRIVGILSDQTNWLEELDQRHALFREFDRVFNSFREGKGKRDASLFEDVCTDLGLAPHEVAFVDDRVGHVQRASACGLRTIHYVSHESFESDLRELLWEA